METSVDKKFTIDQYFSSILSTVIGRDISHISSADLYFFCRMDDASKVVQTKASHLVELGILVAKTSNEVNILDTPATRLRSPVDDPVGLHRIVFLAKQQWL